MPFDPWQSSLGMAVEDSRLGGGLERIISSGVFSTRLSLAVLGGGSSWESLQARSIQD